MAEELYYNAPIRNHENAELSVGDAYKVPQGRQPLSSFAIDTDIKITDLKCSLEGWRELLLPLNSILHWEKQWHPFSIVGVITAVFMTLWLMELSVLTTIATLCLTITVCDFLVPQLASTLLKQEPWTEKEEEQYDNICRGIVLTREKIILTHRSFCLMRTTRPKVYYAIVLTTLIFLAWIGNWMDNLVLLYLLVCFVCLLPGMEEHGLLQKYGGMLTDKIADLATSAKVDLSNKKTD